MVDIFREILSGKPEIVFVGHNDVKKKMHLMTKTRNALLNFIWGLGYLAMDQKILGIGLLISLPFLHWPLLVGNLALYFTYPFVLVLIGHIILTAEFVADAYSKTSEDTGSKGG
ncbi:MAG: hypothetical protein ACFFEL_17330 [Candidatus Thorarchaeota archaeon]